MPVKFKLTHKNIRARFHLQRQFDPTFSLSKMGEMFGVGKMAAYKWCRVIKDEKGAELTDRVRCPMPSGSRKVAVTEWINDGVLAQALARRESKNV